MAGSDAKSSERRGSVGLKDDLARQMRLMTHRSPPARRLAGAIAKLLDAPEGAAIEERLDRAWRARTFAAFYERPLLLLAALRWNALVDGPAHPLHAALRDVDPEADAVTPAAVLEAFDTGRTGLYATLAIRRMQTNETSRAIAWLWPAALAGCSDGKRPLAIVDVGCSAGLNLCADALPNVWRTLDGAPLPIVVRPRVVSRVGLDARPLDVTSADDALWLRACVWPGENERLDRLEAAIEAYRRRRARIELVRCDASAIAKYARPSLDAPPDTLKIVYQTLVAEYLEPKTRAAFEAEMHELVVASPPGAILWVELEIAGAVTTTRPCELRVHARSGGERVTFVLGTTGYHPAEIAIRDDGVARLQALFGASRA